jgi:diguanylate cyclase (GGDEF)-like protein
MTRNADDKETTEIKLQPRLPTLQSTSQGERRPALILLSGDQIATPIPLERSEVVLGRAVEADIRINDYRASRLHARVTLERGSTGGEVRCRIVDQGSTNGTLVNGVRVTEALLSPGDKILIGEQLFRFEMLDDIDRAFQQQVHRLLAHDDLTGLLTSKSFFSELRREAVRAAAESLPFCVLMMDLDYFKEVNDRYGHLVGSRTLETLGTIVKDCLRVGDVAARFGGEEFACFLLDADYAQGLVAAERIRSAVEQYEFPVTRPEIHQERSVLRVTISVGVAAFPDDSTDPIELVELADAALYRAKRNGRNRICAYRPSLAATEKPLPPRRYP